MSGRVEHAKKIASLFFRQLGFDVIEIPECKTQRADLEVRDGIDQYIVEVKEKLDTGSQLEFLANSDPQSDWPIVREPHSSSNRIDGVLKSARKQLIATPAEDNALKLIFLCFSGPNAEMFVSRALYTFYGVQYVAPVTAGAPSRSCIYFHNSFAFSSPQVDGMLLVENHDLQLCLNEYSVNYQSIRRSRLVEKMGAAVYEPAKFCDDDSKIVLRSSVPRSDEQVVLAELERLFGIRYRVINLHRYSF